ncbi:hypothetical protein AJ78_02954 [Emergomyces pasteurianus Ep9510]|uniref:Uncharacterized protein n=1 Tax=Emergomyces pasteurianus Ep9510 TaxID=1447872 RepID=A0A1J9QNT8_9EURO|nr:hypothetical protein AJ78_02954 [Emergomyces pasteurianus Ep9510]
MRKMLGTNLAGNKELIKDRLREVLQLIQFSHEEMKLPEYLKDRDYGSGMVASFTKEKSKVFCAGSDEWVSGLIHTKTFTKTIIKNILDRFTGRKSAI